MDPVHDYQNFLLILSLTLIKYIRLRNILFLQLFFSENRTLAGFV